MGWSERQQKMAARAGSLAGWNDAQRYMVMRAVGCPVVEHAGAEARPSVKASGNQQRHFELYMELAEAAACERPNFPQPANFTTWREAAANGRSKEIAFIMAIFREAREKLPEVFDENALAGFIHRMTAKDEWPIGEPATQLSECNGAQTYRILEGAKAWVGRRFIERDIEPRRFVIPGHVRRAAGAGSV